MITLLPHAAAALCCALRLAASPAPAPAAPDTTPWHPGATFAVASATAIAIALPLDLPLREDAGEWRTASRDRLFAHVDPFGRAHDIVPSLAAAVVLPLLVRRPAWSAAALRIAASYAAADAIEGALKPIVGRHRPAAGRGQWRFHPLDAHDEWHSFPSAHTVHAFSLAAGVAEESRNPWVAGAAYGVAGLVGLERIYLRAHWTTDVTASAVLAISTARMTDGWLRHERLPGRWLPTLWPSASHLVIFPGAIALSHTF